MNLLYVSDYNFELINPLLQLVRLLLRCGAGVDVVNRRGKTPRDVCRSPGIIALIEAAAQGLIQELGSSSGDELPHPYLGTGTLVTEYDNQSNHEMIVIFHHVVIG